MKFSRFQQAKKERRVNAVNYVCRPTRLTRDRVSARRSAPAKLVKIFNFQLLRPQNLTIKAHIPSKAPESTITTPLSFLSKNHESYPQAPSISVTNPRPRFPASLFLPAQKRQITERNPAKSPNEIPPSHRMTKIFTIFAI